MWKLFRRVQSRPQDPHDHPQIMAMSEREVADLPSPFRRVCCGTDGQAGS
ncbi:hypothetical protein POI8812_01430 [Pontivivens insulae]|uniref:Uncharacterized protein n=1 Tax=Pontivivens insulae TaxID=1639689 RepID=A0A2R8AA78_9RHOB|nr:hypothetical protein DFR53_2167 [Pontivivens insulae]SPF29124.1 hypothetical protein POI8812_01430 [Pontivivens insulae]